jgi:hypothetical protein
MDLSIITHPELYPCHIVEHFLTEMEPYKFLSDIVKLKVIKRHLDHAVIHEMLNIEPEQCMLMDLYRDIIEHRMNRLYR